MSCPLEKNSVEAVLIKDLPIESQEKLTRAGWRLDQGIDQTNIYENKSPLIWAINNHEESLVRTLLSKGADPELSDQYGNTPLMAAFLNDRWIHFDIIKSKNLMGFSSEFPELFITARSILCIILEKVDLKNEGCLKFLNLLFQRLRDFEEPEIGIEQIAIKYPLESDLSVIPNSISWYNMSVDLNKIIIIPIQDPNSGFAVILAELYRKEAESFKLIMRRRVIESEHFVTGVDSLIVDYAFDPNDFVCCIQPYLIMAYPEQVCSWLIRYARISFEYHEREKLAKKQTAVSAESKELNELLATAITDSSSVAAPAPRLMPPDNPDAGAGNSKTRNAQLTHYDMLRRREENAADPAPTTHDIQIEPGHKSAKP